MCYLSDEQEIEVLRNAEKLVREALVAVKKVQFSPKFESFASDFLAVEDTLDDACISILRTDEETADEEHEAFLEERHIREERSAYFSQVL